MILYGEKDFEGAIKHLNICIAKTPDPNLIMKRAFASFELGSIDSTLDDCATVLKTAPYMFIVHSVRGRCFEKKGDLLNAMKEYDAYLSKETDPDRRKEFTESKRLVMSKLRKSNNEEVN